MKALLNKIEVASVGILFALGGVAGTLWMLKAIHGSLFACAAASTNPCPFI